MKVQSGGMEVIVVDALLNRHNASGVFDPFAGVKIALIGGKPIAAKMQPDSVAFGKIRSLF